LKRTYDALRQEENCFASFFVFRFFTVT
jgi:hypothetical protein